MTYEALAVSVHERVCTIALKRPDALNAITPTMLRELESALDEAAGDAQIGVIVLTGTGRAFSAGVDLKALGGRSLRGGKVGDLLDLPARAAIEAITTAPQPVIAKVNGACFTGALEIALACDLMVVAEEAKMGDTHAKWGLRPTWGMSARLAAAVGSVRARELSLTARTFTGAEAHAMGMAIACPPLSGLDQAVADLCAQILQNSADSLAAYKRLYDTPAVRQGLAREASSDFPIADTEERLASFRR
ncbi:MAG: enoyl-CoA hydratase/isomerase family protein [Myxococcales bacterium]|nr:enoyl-CoA hydratase/isomerase family protein [Myxococcales bacterium]MDD9970769.1 enoyl-CoA hydratase/isomerase family protein [Myxococcales bacterium]